MSAAAQLDHASQLEAVRIAERMAKAAGKVNPVVMVAACSMLIECAWMVRDPSGYVDFKIKQDPNREEGATP